MEKNKKKIYVCPKCGSENVQIKKWVFVNTNETAEDSEDDAYCCDCNSFFEYLEEKK